MVKLATLIFMLLLQGCVSYPPAPDYEIKKGEKIGVWVDAGNQVTHTHVGNTVFNNFEKNYDLNWHLSEDISGNLKQKLTSAGFDYVEISNQDFKYEDLNGLIHPENGHWEINASKQSVYKKLQDVGLKGIIVVKEKPVTALLECAGGPCSDWTTPNSGLFTRSIFFSTFYRPVAALDANIFLLNPLADLSKGNAFQDVQKLRSANLRNYKSPADFKNLTSDEWLPIESAIKDYINKMTSSAVESLSHKSN